VDGIEQRVAVSLFLGYLRLQLRNPCVRGGEGAFEVKHLVFEVHNGQTIKRGETFGRRVV